MNESTTLYYRKGASDKVYQANLEQTEGGYIVTFAYGRRGAALKTGTKTPGPVGYDQAKKIYERLIREKQGKGYTPGEDGSPYQQTEHEGRDTGIACQLLHPIEEERVGELLADPEYCVQEKHDGRRLLIRKEGPNVEGINRRGLITALAAPVLEAAREIPGDFVLDGEDMGETFVAFDLLRSDGADVCPQPYSYRLAVLEALVPESGAGPLRRTETVVERSAKEALFQMLRDGQAEGAVFKRLSAPYKPGRDGHNDQFKFKFVATASFVTGPMNRAKRSVALRLYRGRRLVSAGNVTIPVNFPIPKPGTVIEVKYLYAFPESGSVYQPVYLGRRDDIPPEDCTIDQLKFKQGAEEVPA